MQKKVPELPIYMGAVGDLMPRTHVEAPAQPQTVPTTTNAKMLTNEVSSRNL